MTTEITTQANTIIRKHVLWSMGAGLMPLPLLDIAAVTAVQLDMLNQLARLYEVDFTESRGKAFASALAGGALARVAASMIKGIPGIGTLIGELSMPILAGASTFALGATAADVFRSGGDLLDFDLESARRAYKNAFDEGKEFVSGLKEKEEASQSVFEALEKLGELKEKGVITDEEFEARKEELLGRL